MRAQIKVVILVAVVVTVTLAAVIWKTQTLLLEDSFNFVNDSAMKQLAPLKHLISDKLENQKKDLARFATSREAQGPGHATSFGDFDAIALVEPNSSAQWLPAWIEKGPSLRAEKWTDGYDLTLLRSLPYAKVKDGSSLWVRLSDAQGAPLYAVLDSVEVQAPVAATSAIVGSGLPSGAPVGSRAAVTTLGSTRRAVIVGFASENPLAAVTEDYIGSTSVVYIVDDRGYVASHVKNSYVGNSFSDDKLTHEITSTAKVTDTKETVDMDGQKVIGHFERVEHTNLAAVIMTPLAATTSLATAVSRTIILVGGFLGLLSLLVSYLVGGTLQDSEPLRSSMPERNDSGNAGTTLFTPTRILPTEIPRQELADESAKAALLVSSAPSFTGASSEPSRELVDGDRLRAERRHAFEAFNAGLADRLREPLLAILGHAQLAKSKSTDDVLIAHTDSIEREARLAKEAIERFQIIEQSSSLGPVTERCDLERVVLAALAEKAIEIEGSGIVLDQKITHVPFVRGRANDIESMIVHILENSIEAVRDRPFKKMTIHLSWLSDRVRLLISDSGIGMSRDIKERAFEPFFKGFEAPRHMGLGLAFVETTIKRVNANYELESSPGEGTVFTIEFPVELDAKKEFEASTAAPGLQQINESIDAFTLGGRKPIAIPTFTPGTFNEFTISSITSPQIEPTSEGFEVKIRRPKPRG